MKDINWQQQQILLYLIQMIQQIKERKIKDALDIFKFVAFHELYMENFRQDLSKDQNYDSGVAFNKLDMFKHNKIIPQEVFCFLQIKENGETLTNIYECNQFIKSLNKSAIWLDYEGFLELSLPRKNLILKQQSLSRLNSVKPAVGTYLKVLNIKQWSQKKVTQLVKKQISFIREHLFRKQKFTMDHKGDIYSILQQFFHDTYRKCSQLSGDQQIRYPQFYQKCRKSAIIFNQDQFQALVARSRKQKALNSSGVKNNTIIQNLGKIDQQIYLTKENITELLLTSNLSLKQQFGHQVNLPMSKIFERRPSSYQRNLDEYGNLVRNQNSFQAKMQAQQQIRVKQRLEYDKNVRFAGNIGRICYPYYIADQHNLSLSSYQFRFREKQREWNQKVNNMDSNEINIYYALLDRKK